MSKGRREPGFDTLLELDGEVMVVDPAGGHWVKFSAKKIPPTPEKPYGIDYSLTLHSSTGERLVGFDNAHPVASGKGPGKKKSKKQDHKHRMKTIKPYDYKNAATLLEDFWAEVDSVLRERGIKT